MGRVLTHCGMGWSYAVDGGRLNYRPGMRRVPSLVPTPHPAIGFRVSPRRPQSAGARLRRLSPLFHYTVLLAWAVAPPAGAAVPPPETFAFAALGCLPYSRTPAAAEGFGRVIAEINRQAPAFTVHLGDILGSDERCTDELLAQRRADFDRFTSALVYTPGDNEWTDTHHAKAGGYVPTERLARLRRVFFAEERSLGQKPIALVSQRHDARFAEFVENARWTRGGVVFATVHVVGSKNNRQAAVPGAMDEWRRRDLANEAWLHATFADATATNAPGVALFFQADPFEADKDRGGYEPGFERFLVTLEKEARAYGRPVLLVHADEHRYRLEVGMRFNRDAPPIPNVTRLETFGAMNMHAVIVTVDPGSEQVFLPAALIVPGNALPVLPRPKTLARQR